MRTLLFITLSLGVLHAGEPLRVAIYDGPGSAGKGIPRMTELLSGRPDFTVTKLPPAAIPQLSVKDHDIIIFTGGSGSKQAAAIKDEGVAAVSQFVESGGGYVGICAGAYLACSNFKWGTKIIDARTVSSKWMRGTGDVQMVLTEEGKAILGHKADEVTVRYANGPIMMPFGQADVPDMKPLAYFNTEISRNGSPVGIMTGAPAIAVGEFGKGRVVAISPHPEQTAGLDEMVRNAVRWSGKREPITANPVP
ncbi:MAG: hypothetical protein JNJ83_17220 [Verrucomicrobiaceae bacterium]|nr:hypothetical protein [Verrucomicrobiaceae bacterium]